MNKPLLLSDKLGGLEKLWTFSLFWAIKPLAEVWVLGTRYNKIQYMNFPVGVCEEDTLLDGYGYVSGHQFWKGV